MKYVLALIVYAAAMAGPAKAADTQLQSVDVRPTDPATLQRGAKYFFNYCAGCHSIRYMRYRQLAGPLAIDSDALGKNLVFGDRRIHDRIIPSMNAADAEQWFGKAPPDLTEVARTRGADWVYTYLKSFYLDEDARFGVNNRLLPNTAMPDVLWALHGPRRPVYSDTGSGQDDQSISGYRQVRPGTMSRQEYNAMLRDLVSFLVFLSEPHRATRYALAPWVIGFIVLFTVLAYLLKREVWKDVG